MFRRIAGYARPYWQTLLTIAILIALMAGLNQAEPFVTKRIMDTLTQGKLVGWQGIAQLLGILLIVKVTSSSLNRVTWYLTNIFAVQFESHLKRVGFNHLMTLSLGFFNDQAAGKTMSKLDRGVNRLIQIVNNSGMHFLPSFTTAVISFVIVMSYDWKIGAGVLVAFVPYVFINRWRFHKNSSLEKKEYKLYDNQYNHFWEVLSSMQLVKAFRAENFEIERLKTFFKEWKDLRGAMERNTNIAFSGDLFLEAWNWGTYAYIVWQTYLGNLSIGTLVLLISLVQLIRQPLWQLNWIFWEVKRAGIGAKDFFRIIDSQPEVTDPAEPKALDLAELKGEIVFDDVTFVYKNAPALVDPDDEELNTNIGPQEVFKNLSFTAEGGKTTALVGPSGSGKTTVAQLVMRFFDPQSGRVLLDGVDIREYSQRDLRSSMGLVSQDANLFADTIMENLRYAKPDATEEEMWEACKAAYADEFIKKLPLGLKTEIGDRGVKLSGGQRQRLSIARTILRDPKIILLDEATSALDSESEMYIQEALAKLLKGRTAIIIAHRLSTIARADKIVVVKNQKVFEEGTHEKLLKTDGLYASLFKIQSGNTKKLKEWDLVG
jgi:ATP-binding cassette subfamily B protein